MGYLSNMRKLFKKIFALILLIFLLTYVRVILIYPAIELKNEFLVNIMSIANPLIDLQPIPGSIIGEIFAYYSHTPLIFAIRKGSYEAVEILLKNGANPNATDNISEYYNKLPLEFCHEFGIGKDRYKIAKLLIQNGANGFDDKHFITNLVANTELEDDNETQQYKYELFLEWMDKHYSYDESLNFQIIYWSVYGNAIDEFLYMMKNYDIDVNYKENDDWHILEPAARNRNVEFFKLLIDYGANIDFIGKNGMTIEDYILDEKYDKRIVDNEYIVIDYNKEKKEMLEILRETREKKRVVY